MTLLHWYTNNNKHALLQIHSFALVCYSLLHNLWFLYGSGYALRQIICFSPVCPLLCNHGYLHCRNHIETKDYVQAVTSHETETMKLK